MNQIDINCDMGEGFGIYRIGQDDSLLPLISSASIACGFHAGDPQQMAATVEKCLQHNVAVGAHPGYPDLAGFGRRAMSFTRKELKNLIIYQVGALIGITKSLGGQVVHVKPHGALYNSAVASDEVAGAVVEAVLSLEGPSLVALAGSRVVRLARAQGLPVLEEGFADRRYKADGTLLDRSFDQAVISSPAMAAKQVLNMVKNQRVSCYRGGEISLRIDTVCIHGDNRKAVQILKQIRLELLNNEVMISIPSFEK